jgi:hypothetical protein
MKLIRSTGRTEKKGSKLLQLQVASEAGRFPPVECLTVGNPWQKGVAAEGVAEVTVAVVLEAVAVTDHQKCQRLH